MMTCDRCGVGRGEANTFYEAYLPLVGGNRRQLGGTSADLCGACMVVVETAVRDAAKFAWNDAVKPIKKVVNALSEDGCRDCELFATSTARPHGLCLYPCQAEILGCMLYRPPWCPLAEGKQS